MKVPHVPACVPLPVLFLHRHDFIDRCRPVRGSFQPTIQQPPDVTHGMLVEVRDAFQPTTIQQPLLPLLLVTGQSA
jgi:hypothetical protein